MRNIDHNAPAELDGDRGYCKVFGCGKHLSLIESLAGDLCTKHMNPVKEKYRSSFYFTLHPNSVRSKE